MAADTSPPTLRDDLNALLALQVIDTKIDRARAAIAGLDTGAKIAATFNAQKATSEALRAAANKSHAGQKDAEMRLATIETKAAQVTKSMFSGTVTGSRELENLQRELDMLARQKDDGEMKVLEAMEASGEAVSTANSAEQTLAGLAKTYQGIRAVYKERHAALSAEIAADEAERTKAAKAVPPTLLSRYEALRPKKKRYRCHAARSGRCLVRRLSHPAQCDPAGRSALGTDSPDLRILWSDFDSPRSCRLA